jgi:hypothetical protein
MNDDDKLESLYFELVDYAVEYIGWKRKISYYKPGLPENFKIEIVLKKIINKMEIEKSM